MPTTARFSTASDPEEQEQKVLGFQDSFLPKMPSRALWRVFLNNIPREKTTVDFITPSSYGEYKGRYSMHLNESVRKVDSFIEHIKRYYVAGPQKAESWSGLISSNTLELADNSYTAFMHTFQTVTQDGNEKLELKRTVLNFEQLKDDWDGYGGKPISQYAVNRVLKLIDWLYGYKQQKKTIKSIFIAPLGDGGIQVDVHGRVVEMEIFASPLADGKIEYLIERLEDNPFCRYQEGVMVSLPSLLALFD